jgi:hypothetical protein
MMRWSLRRRRLRTGNANTYTSRPDASRRGAHRLPSDGAPRSLPPAGGRPMANGYPAEHQPGHGSPAAGYPRGATFTPLPGADAAMPQPPSAWPEVCEQFSLHLLTLVEQLRMSLDELEADEPDPERLQRLYRIDHAATRMRRVSRDLRTLAGRPGEELEGPVTSLLDVIRMALSAIERYTQVSVAKVADLAVLGYAADDVSMLMAALLDNATRYSPGPVTVSAHLTGDGSVLLRVEDAGIGMEPYAVANVNAMLSGPAREIDERAGLRTGFPVVHRLARKHQIGVRLATRPSPASGTIAMVTLPPQLLCEVPDIVAAGSAAPPAPRPPAERVTVLPGAAGRRPTAAGRPGPSRRPDWPQPAGGEKERPADQPALSGGLPLREHASLRGGRPRRDGEGDNEPPPPLSPEAQMAARRAFAADVAAFSLGSQEASSPEPIGEGTVQ